jgi:type II secretory pathway predicted ATPase ExeA
MTIDIRATFGFHTTPFTRELPTREHLRLPVFEQPLAGLRQAIEKRMSAALIAPAGSGKTALLRRLVEELPEARYQVRYIKVTSLSKRDLCREIAAVLGLPPAGTYPMLVRRLQEHFEQVRTEGALCPVLLVDESQDLRPEVLAMLGVLTNFQMDSALVLSLVLAGQSALRTLLQRDSHEAIARRIVHYATLRPLSQAETRDYLEHRTTVAGATAFPFDAQATEVIYEISRGNLRTTLGLGLDHRLLNPTPPSSRRAHLSPPTSVPPFRSRITRARAERNAGTLSRERPSCHCSRNNSCQRAYNATTG